MRVIDRPALVLSAVLATALLAACSDSPTAPAVPAARVAAPSFALIQQPTNYPTAPNTITVCSANAGATFNVSFANDVANSKLIPPLVGAGPIYTLSVAAGACQTIWSKLDETSSPADDITTATVVQVGQDAGYTFDMVEAAGTVTLPGAADNVSQTATLRANAFHGATATFTQKLLPPPPPEVCDFSTFGGFVLLPNNISYGGNAGRVDGGFAYGSLNFVNHTTGDHIHVWNVTDYGHPDSGPLSGYADSRLAYGLGSVNGGPVDVPVEFRFLDSGEPAKKLGDRVYLIVNGQVLIPEQEVDGGNIQLHAKCKKAPKAEKH